MINKDNTGISLYRQIVDSLISSIQDGQLATGDPIPSLNALKDHHQVSRDTVLMAYNELKTRGIIDSLPGKGYYVSSTTRTRYGSKPFYRPLQAGSVTM